MSRILQALTQAGSPAAVSDQKVLAGDARSANAAADTEANRDSAPSPERLAALSLIMREFRRGRTDSRPLSILMLFTDDGPETTAITLEIASFLGCEATSPLLLIDADDSQRRLTKFWKAESAPGLLQTLDGEAEQNPECFLPSSELGICFCPFGQGSLSLGSESFQNRLVQRTAQWQQVFHTLLFYGSPQTRQLSALASVVDRTFAFVQLGKSALAETHRRISELQTKVPLQSVLTIDPRDWD